MLYPSGSNVDSGMITQMGNSPDMKAALVRSCAPTKAQRPTEPNRLTPARVRRGFRNLRPALPCPARAPKPTQPGPGRPLGSKNQRPATRYDVGKTVRRPETLLERDHVRLQSTGSGPVGRAGQNAVP